MGFWKYVLGTPRNYALTFLTYKYINSIVDISRKRQTTRLGEIVFL